MDNRAGNVGAGGGTGHLEGHKRIPWTGERSEKSGAAGCIGKTESDLTTKKKEPFITQGRDKLAVRLRQCPGPAGFFFLLRKI